VYDMATVGITITDVTIGILYIRITIMLNGINETNTEKENS